MTDLREMQLHCCCCCSFSRLGRLSFSNVFLQWPSISTRFKVSRMINCFKDVVIWDGDLACDLLRGSEKTWRYRRTSLVVKRKQRGETRRPSVTSSSTNLPERHRPIRFLEAFARNFNVYQIRKPVLFLIFHTNMEFLSILCPWPCLVSNFITNHSLLIFFSFYLSLFFNFSLLGWTFLVVFF